jgi:hypothetical protein
MKFPEELDLETLLETLENCLEMFQYEYDFNLENDRSKPSQMGEADRLILPRTNLKLLF